MLAERPEVGPALLSSHRLDFGVTALAGLGYYDLGCCCCHTHSVFGRSHGSFGSIRGATSQKDSTSIRHVETSDKRRHDFS
jgi:hypothetical protein